ncbi:MAG TPA: hypothetical protein PKI03_34825 [Pseudomonadota bacterium]|nr:hypothetical protein [Pseudomonadota bacterium]
MEGRGNELPEPGMRETVRRYFARLTLRAGPNAIAAGWAQLPVEHYFVALRQPPRLINLERRSATLQSGSLGTLFVGVRWV